MNLLEHLNWFQGSRARAFLLTSTLMVTLAEEESDGTPMSEAMTVNTITPFRLGSIDSRSTVPLFLIQPESLSMLKLAL